MSWKEQMEKMEKAFAWVMDHLFSCDAAGAAAAAGYEEEYFRKKCSVFCGVPFDRLLTRLRLRDAAEKMHETGAMQLDYGAYGFADRRAFTRAFRREFGMAPRDFIKSGRPAPDIELAARLDGELVAGKYEQTMGRVIRGWKFYPESGNETNLLAEASYPFAHPDPHIDLTDDRTQIGIWWFEKNEDLCYVMGPAEDEGEPLGEGWARILIPGGEYRVFSIRRGESASETAKRGRMLARYAFFSWAVLNKKKTNPLGYTFEKFDRDRICFYLPLVDARTFRMLQPREKDQGMDTWIRYIDAHIRDPITVESLADHFFYSKRHFYEVFKLYYGIAPTEYIHKKRLYLAAAQLREENADVRQVMEKYYFKSPESFRRLFYREFHTEPENYAKVRFHVTDLAQYYSHYKNKLQISFLKIRAFRVVAKRLVSLDEEGEMVDIPELLSFRLRARGVRETPCVALWANGEGGWQYLLGEKAKSGRLPEEGECEVWVEGGRYAVFRSLLESDAGRIASVYRRMSRCVFYGWIKENRVRVDLNRITFVVYAKEKLYFYVPLTE